MTRGSFKIGIQTHLTLEQVTSAALLYHMKWVLRRYPTSKSFLSFILEIHDIYVSHLQVTLLLYKRVC